VTRPRNDNFLRALLKEPTDYTPATATVQLTVNKTNSSITWATASPSAALITSVAPKCLARFSLEPTLSMAMIRPSPPSFFQPKMSSPGLPAASHWEGSPARRAGGG